MRAETMLTRHSSKSAAETLFCHISSETIILLAGDLILSSPLCYDIFSYFYKLLLV